MHLDLSRETVFLAVFVAWTLLTITVRLTKSVDNSWPVVYWAAILAVSIYWSRETWDPQWVLAGTVAALFLRFEFMNELFERLVRTVELLLFGYVALTGVQQIWS